MSEERLRHIVRSLAQAGYRVVYDDDGQGGQICGPSEPVTASEVNQLGADGWICNLPNGSGCVLSDAGRKAFLKSTDELRDGTLSITKGDRP